MHVLRQSVYEEESVQLFFRDTYSKLMLGVKLFSLSFLSVVLPILVHLNSSSALLLQGFPRYSGKCWESGQSALDYCRRREGSNRRGLAVEALDLHQDCLGDGALRQF